MSSHKSDGTFLLFMQSCVITLVCTNKQCRATELFMDYTPRHTGEGSWKCESKMALMHTMILLSGLHRTLAAGGLLIKQPSSLLMISIRPSAYLNGGWTACMGTWEVPIDCVCSVHSFGPNARTHACVGTFTSMQESIKPQFDIHTK